AVVAALGIALLVAAVLGASRPLRRAMLGAGMVAAVLVPTVLLLRIADLTGVRRLQDPWGAAVAVAAGAGEVREAWSVSFRSDPAGVIDVHEGGGAALVARALGRAGV